MSEVIAHFLNCFLGQTEVGGEEEEGEGEVCRRGGNSHGERPFVLLWVQEEAEEEEELEGDEFLLVRTHLPNETPAVVILLLNVNHRVSSPETESSQSLVPHRGGGAGLLQVYH